MKAHYVNAVMNHLATHEQLSTCAACKLLQVSPATVRRIFNEMAQQNHVVHVHGGVQLIPARDGATIPFAIREQWQSGEKELLARKALENLRNDSTTFVHSGTTTLFLAKYITQGTFITDSVAFAQVLCRRFPEEYGPNVILTGGTLDRKAGMLHGYKTERSIRSYHADFMITSVRALDSGGLIETDDIAVGTQRAMMSCSDKVIVLADHLKYSRKGTCRLAGWNEVFLLITTECEENRRMIGQLRDKGVRIVTVPES
ncbi:MAG: DeoR/GlpR family DNA-binding transcription regulator [Victivallaceae bacterium]|nr:DeoR/GlpR family DNA-binding transcription regulator [Victivallaceae bacterium]